MVDFWNFKDFMVVPQFYWLWMLLAAFIGFVTALVVRCGGR